MKRISAFVFGLLWIATVAVAQGLPVFNADGAPVAKRDEARFAHIVTDKVTFASAVDSLSVTLRTSSTEGRTSISFTDANSYLVICSGADSVVRVSGSHFRIWYATALRGKSQQYIAIGN